MRTAVPRDVQPLRALALHAQRRAAQRDAVERFAVLQPHWHALRFDRFFVRRIPRSWIEAKDAEAIAREWTCQFRYHDARQRERDVRQLVPVADGYLTLLAAAEAEHDTRAIRARPHPEVAAAR